MRRIFFFLNRTLFTSTTINSNKTKHFSTCLLFHFLSCSYYYYNTINTLFYFNSLLFTITFIRIFFFKNILSFLAGKSEQICTAFPLTTFSRQKYARRAFKKFSAKSLIQFLVQKFKNKQYFPATCRAQGYFRRQDAVFLRVLPSTRLANCHAAKSRSIFCPSQHEN